MTNNFSIKILFFGTSEFAVPILRKLIENKLDISAVVTQPDKPKGRKQRINQSPIKKLALEHNMKVLQPVELSILNFKSFDKLPATKRGADRTGFKILNFNLIIVASYGKIIPKEILESAKYGAINIHPSLLPTYRGASPIQAAIMNGDEETGVTIMLMDEKMDHGPILAQESYKTEKGETSMSLQEILAQKGADLLIETIPKWLRNEITPIVQNETKANYTKILTKEDGRIDWKKSAREIERQTRALNPWPGSWAISANCLSPQSDRQELADAIAGEKRVRILEAEAFNASNNLPEGNIFSKDKEMFARCGEGCLKIKKWQIEGKKEMSGEEFLRGHNASGLKFI